jgi:tetratricopeptide (TPR) repeat protein
MDNELTSELSAKGYWPAKAREYLERRQYSKSVEVCTSGLKDNPEILSGRIVLAQALYHTNQLNEAESQFYRILQTDPDNILALKYLGDLKFRAGDEITAFAYYEKVLKLDKYTHGLKSSLDKRDPEKLKATTLLTFKKNGESIDDARERLRQLPFDTETTGDLLLEQGHTRMANRIFKNLFKKNQSPRLLEKIEKIKGLNKTIMSAKMENNETE